jgi:uncharacterized protein
MRHAAGIAFVGIVILVVTVVAVGLRLSRPAQASIGPAPGDLAIEAVEFSSGSGALRGWFMAGRPGGGAVVLMHGVYGNRLTMMRRARMLNGIGFSVLAFDFQAHGESTGARITFGYLEARDADAAVAFMRKRLPAERLGIVGSSLGGAAALLGPGPLAVDALVLEAVYPEIGAAIANRVRFFLGPVVGDVSAEPLSYLFQLLLGPILGVRPVDLRPIDRIGEVRVPLLVASGTRDNRTPLSEAKDLFARAREPKTFWAVDGAGHVDLEAYAPEEYRRRVVPFLVAKLQRP